MRYRAWYLIIVSILSMLAGCQWGAAQAPANGYLRVDIDTSPLSLDPRYATDAVSARINELIFESLARVDAHGRFINGLAQGFQWSRPTQLVFHLRRGVRFSNGQPLTARDVKYSYDSVIDPASASPKRAGMELLASVEAPDDYTIRFNLRRPYAAALEWALLGVVPYGTPPERSGGHAPAGSGPFRLTNFVRDESLILDRNPHHSASSSSLKGVAFRVVPDPTVCALELIKGIAQFTENNLPPSLLNYMRAHRGLRVTQSVGTTYQYLEFNFRDPRLADLRVRRAIAMAIDRDAIVASVLGHTARPASGMLAPENWAYEPDVTRYPYDPAAARILLDKAGYPMRSDGKRFTLTYKTTQGEERRLLAQAFAAMLGDIGIELKVRSYEWPTFYSDIQRGNFDLTSLAWIGINDPHHYYVVLDSKMIPPRGLNRGAYVNPAMDKLLEAGEMTFDPARRKALYSQMQKLAAADLPYVSLWWQDNVAVMSRDVSGFEPYPNGSLRSFGKMTLGPASAPERARRPPPLQNWAAK